MPTRTRAYAALAEHKYRLPVYPVVLNILSPPAHVVIPTCYDSHFLGLHAHQDYRVINMWDVLVDVAFQQELSPLLPFVPVLHGGDNEPTIRKAVRTLRTDERLSDLEPLLGFFAMFVLSRKVVEQMMGWNMKVFYETPWYQEIWQEGHQQGIEKGVEQGQQTIVLTLLREKFGMLPPDIQSRLAQLTSEQIEAIVHDVLVASSLDDVLAHLPASGDDSARCN